MENTITSNDQKKHQRPEHDDFDFDSISFKPVTKGLGFHQDQKRTLKQNRRRPSVKTSSERPEILTTRVKENSSPEALPLDSELKQFYATADDEMFSSEIFEKGVPEDLNLKPSLSTQMFAWSLDFILILSSLAVTLILFVLGADIELDTLLSLITAQDALIFSSSLFVVYYLMYFSVLDRSGTMGKLLFKIKVVSTLKKDINIFQTCLRAIISMASLPLLCLPLMINIQGKLSNTKVVK